MKHLKLISRADKEKYLMTSGLFSKEKLSQVSDVDIDTFFESAIEVKMGVRRKTSSSLPLIKRSKTIIVYYLYSSTKISTEYDDNEYPVQKIRSYSSLEKEIFHCSNIEKAFEREDGDGDDCGSWSRELILITSENDSILFDLRAKQHDYLKRCRDGADLELLNKDYAESLQRIKSMIKEGGF